MEFLITVSFKEFLFLIIT